MRSPDPAAGLTGTAPASLDRALPTGTVTFLFTDIEGSTRLLRELGSEGYRAALDAHDRILRTEIDRAGGVTVSTEGDAFFAAFPTATGAVAAAVGSQRALAAIGHATPIRVRMGLHTGAGTLSSDGRTYLGIDVNRAARIAAAGHGGQTLVSAATRTLVGAQLPAGVAIRDLGSHRLKDLADPESLAQLVIDDLRAEFPALRGAATELRGVPAQLTTFIGRSREVDDVSGLVADARLVTLTGPGGTGKTRLAIEAARRSLADFGDGGAFVDLAPVASADLVPSAVAAALGVKEESARPLADVLVAYLRDRRLLLVLDNFEHVTGAAALPERILADTEGVHVLVTSRVTLRIYGEREYGVPPLAVPDPAEVATTDPADLERHEAIALFVDRARAVRHDFRLTTENRAAVAAICARLDGLPLAIELAASRVKLLTPEQLLARLERALTVLTGGSRSLPERQRTLRDTIAWSYRLLEPAEQRLLERASVFAGAVPLDAVDAVCNPGGELGIDAFDGMASLVDKSLARAVDGGGGQPAFRLLETIREFAGERLSERGEDAPVRDRHAAYFRRFAVAAEPHLLGEDQAAWLERVSIHHDNIRAALRWAIGTGDGELAAAIASPLWRFWQYRGHLNEARALLETILELPMSRPARFDALIATGGIAYWQNDLARAEACYREAVTVADEIDDSRLQGVGRFNLAFIPVMHGDPAQATVLFEESRGYADEAGDIETLVAIEDSLGWVYMQTDRFDEAIEIASSSLTKFRQLGNRFKQVDALGALGQAYRLSGRHAEARRCFREALVLLEQAGDLPMTARFLWLLAANEWADGRPKAAARLWGAGQDITDRVGGSPAAGMRVEDPTPGILRALGEEATAAALAEGRRMHVSEIIASLEE